MEFKVGDRVKLVIEPKDAYYGAGYRVRRGDTGTVHAISPPNKIQVNFDDPESFRQFNVLPGEIELVEKPSPRWRARKKEELLSYEEQLELIRTQSPMFKTVLVLADGSRVSPWAGGINQYQSLDYKEGEVTRAPEGTKGISLNLSVHVTVAPDKKRDIPGSYFAVHECWAIGKKMGAWDNYYPAILLGKEVWNEKPVAPPEPVWKDVTEECTTELRMGQYVSVLHGGTERVLLSSKGMHIWAAQGGDCKTTDAGDYRVEVGLYPAYPCGSFKVFKKV